MKEVKKMYERPSMNRILVQIEDGFIAASTPVGDVVTEDTMVDIHVQEGFEDIDMTNKTEWK